MKNRLSRIKYKAESMLRVLARFIRLWAYRVNTKWGWFFTNGMKQPYEEQTLVFPEDL